MSGGGKKGGDATIGFRYLFGIHMGIGHGPVDEVVAAKVGDQMAWQGSKTSSGTFSINMPDLFGGEKKEGGIVGQCTIMMGDANQDVTNGPVATILTPGRIPGFRGKLTIYFDGMIAAMNPYPKKWAWRIRRATAGWDGVVMRPDLAKIWLGGTSEAPLPTPTDPPIPYNPPARDFGQAGETRAEHQPHVDAYNLVWEALPVPRPEYDSLQGHVLFRAPETDAEYAARVAAYDEWYVNTVPVVPNDLIPIESLTDDPRIMAMNPAHIILECHTNRKWGKGLNRAVIDLASFEACAQTLFNEGFGLCMKWNRKDLISTFVQSVLDHIGAAIYADRQTSLLTLKLIRKDYIRANLPLFTTSTGIISIDESSASTASGAINEIQVTYRDPPSNKDRIVKAQNLGAIQSSAGIISSTSKEYRGLPTNSLARRVAQRDLRTQAGGLRRFSLTMDRRAWNINPGDVIRIQDEPRMVPDMVVRVATVKDGTLLDGKITLTVAQDVFSLPNDTFTQSEPVRWSPPNVNPCIGRHEVFEMPYFLLNRSMPNGDFAGLDPTSAFFGVVAEQGTPSNVSYDLAEHMGAPSGDEAPTDDFFCGYTPLPPVTP